MRKKPNGFTKFMAKLEGKPVRSSKPKWSVKDLDYVVVYCLVSLRNLCDGYPDELEQAFSWRHTPQGYDYWRSRCFEGEPMSEEDWEFCDELYRSRT